MSDILYDSEEGWVVAPWKYDVGNGTTWRLSDYQVVAPYGSKIPISKPVTQLSTEQATVKSTGAECSEPNSKKRKRSIKKVKIEDPPEVLEYLSWLETAVSKIIGDSKVFGKNLDEPSFPTEDDAFGKKASDSPDGVEEVDFVKWRELCDLVPRNLDEIIPTITLVEDVDAKADISPVFQGLISNEAATTYNLDILGQTFLIPPYSRFLISDLSNTRQLLYEKETQYDLVLLDPPWPNKSVRRGSRYQEMDIYDLFKLPVKSLIGPGSLVAVWVTNKSRYQHFVKQKLFPGWGLQLVAEWTWVKVTTRGQLVLDLRSQHRKPFEILYIGRVEGKPDMKELPAKRIICSVPSLHHSRKPLLDTILQPYLPPTNPKKLEMFARNLMPGWTSWGNEVLKFNHAKYLHEHSGSPSPLAYT
ncbi:MT-A70-domain-containing protein [Phlyctochytrium arcticum]|nr:MT-A70-domain-containing protein [Phlyctochytrium arcticum]